MERNGNHMGCLCVMPYQALLVCIPAAPRIIMNEYNVIVSVLLLHSSFKNFRSCCKICIPVQAGEYTHGTNTLPAGYILWNCESVQLQLPCHACML